MTVKRPVSTTGQRLRLALAMLAAAPLVLATSLASPTSAHTTEDPYAYLFVSEATLDGRVELSIADLGQVLGRSLGDDDQERKAELERSTTEIHAYIEAHLTIGVSGSS